MMGVYGMLAVGFSVFALRYPIPEDQWSDRWPEISFWSLDIGLLWRNFATLLPSGALQLYKVVASGYADARSLGYLQGEPNAFLEWLLLPGDVVFIVGGALPLLWMTWLGVRHRVGRTRLPEAPEEMLLFTEVGPERPMEPAGGAVPAGLPGTPSVRRRVR